MTYLLSYKRLDAVIVKVNHLLLYLLRIELLHSAHDLATGKLLNKESCTFCSILHNERVCSALITERCISLEAMSLRALSDRYRIEICALKEYVYCIFCNARLLAAEYTCEAHWLFCVGNHEICCAKSALYAVEGHKLLSFLCSAHYHLAAGNLRCIECMKRLADLMENEVGDVDNVVDRSETDRKKFLLKPLRRGCHLDTLDSSSGISWSPVCCSNLYRDRLSLSAVCPC